MSYYKQPPPLAENLAKALSQDYFLVILISSRTRGKFKSLNLPFGLGKSTLSMKISYVLHGGEAGYEEDAIWDQVFDHMKYYPSKLARMLTPNEDKHPKIPCAIYEATQMTAPADQSVPGVIRRLASYLTENRPECSTLILNGPSISDIAKPLRQLVAYELIVWERGHYEVQQIINHKNFKNPLQDIMELVFVEGDPTTTVFTPLPERIQKRYDKWRAEEKIPFNNSLIRELERYEKVRAGEVKPQTPEEASIASKGMLQARKVKRGY